MRTRSLAIPARQRRTIVSNNLFETEEARRDGKKKAVNAIMAAAAICTMATRPAARSDAERLELREVLPVRRFGVRHAFVSSYAKPVVQSKTPRPWDETTRSRSVPRAKPTLARPPTEWQPRLHHGAVVQASAGHLHMLFNRNSEALRNERGASAVHGECGVHLYRAELGSHAPDCGAKAGA